MGKPAPTEWKCDCGKWVPIGFSRHTHIAEATLSLADMIAAREAGADPFATSLTWVYRTGEHETR